MISDIQSDLGGWVRTLVANPDHVLRLGKLVLSRDLFTNKELLGLYDPSGGTGTTANGLGRELKRAGFAQVCQGRSLRLSSGSQDRYYVVRNQEKWKKASSTACVKHIGDDKSKGGKY